MDPQQPWLKWYPCDSRADPKLRMCSLAARGLWFDLIGLMHEPKPYGHLLVNGRPPSVKQLTLLLGAGQRAIQILLTELDATGVYSLAAKLFASRFGFAPDTAITIAALVGLPQIDER